MKVKHYLLSIFFIFFISINCYSTTTVPLKLNVSAVLRYSDGTEINTTSSENVKIGLYTSTTDFVWRKTYSLMITNGLIEATLEGTGTNSGNSSIALSETLFETENLKVGFTIVENGVEKLALVDLTSQPYSIKSALADYANSAGDTTKLQGKVISSTTPTSNQVLVYLNDQWVPSDLTNTMVNIDSYSIPLNSETEVSGTIDNMKIEKLLGKKLTSAVNNGQEIPTGSVLMFSPNVDSPNGAFHPSSGDPIDGEVLTWDSSMSVWTPSVNSLVKLDDVTAPDTSTPVKNVLVYDDALKKYKLIDIGISYLNDVDTAGANSDNLFLQYNVSSGAWQDQTIEINELSDITITTVQNGDFLKYNSTSGIWENQSIDLGELANLSLVDAAAGNILKYNGASWVDGGLTIEEMTNVDTTNVNDGDFLKYNSNSATWVDATIAISEMTDVDTYGSTNGEILKYNGSTWVDDSLAVEEMTNVDTSGVINGNFLKYNGTAWVDATIAVSEMTDINTSGANNGDFLKYNSSSGDWEDATVVISEMTDVNTSGSSTGEILKYNGSTWVDGSLTIEEMTNVDTSGVINGNFLKYNGTAWVDATITISEMTDINTSGVSNGDLLKYNSTSGNWEDATITLTEIANVDTTGAVDGKVLMHNGTSWVATAPVTNSTMLTDFDTSGASNGEFLKYNGSNWVNNTIAISEMTDVNTAESSSGKILKYNGTTWVDDSLTIEEMTNVDTSGVSNGNFLKYNGTAWVDATIAVSEMTDINTSGANNGDLLKFNSTSGVWEDATITISEMTDINISGVSNGDVLKYNSASSTWEDGTLSLTELNNVDLSNAVLGNVLTYNNGNWEIGSPVLGTTRATTMFVGASNATPTTNSEVLLHVNGDAQVDGAIYISGGSDLAEGFHIVADSEVEPGTVVSIDPNNIGKLVVSSEANDTKVAGVVSGGNGINAGLIMTQTGTLADGEYPIALTGRVWVKCSNENGAVGVGDLLTTASKDGHAMRVGDDGKSGSILGKAMSPCSNNGMVLTLISLQ